MAYSMSSVIVGISPAVVVVQTPAASRTSSSSSSSAIAHCFSSGRSATSSANCCRLSARNPQSVVGGFPSLAASQWRDMTTSRTYRFVIAKAAGESAETALAETKWGPPIQLATGKIPDDVDLKLFESLLYQWGASLTQNANLPLPVPLKVDRIAGGVRLGYVKVVDATVEEVCHIDVVVFPKSDDEPKAMMRALRNGKLKEITPPAEPLIMQSLLQALRTAVARSRTQ